MAGEFICGGDKYEVGGSTKKVIGLPLNVVGLPEAIEVEGTKLLLKTEFHASLVCTDQLIKKHNITVPNFPDKVVDDFCEFIKENDVSFVRYTGEFRFVEDRDRKTIVAMCEISNLNRFFDFLNEKYTLSLEYPPTHVTIYTLQPNKGIFLVDQSDLDTRTNIIPDPLGGKLESVKI